jgi:hypothetical protein
MREELILLSSDGPDENVIKLKPPMVFSQENADQVVRVLDQVLAEVGTMVKLFIITTVQYSFIYSLYIRNMYSFLFER